MTTDTHARDQAQIARPSNVSLCIAPLLGALLATLALLLGYQEAPLYIAIAVALWIVVWFALSWLSK